MTHMLYALSSGKLLVILEGGFVPTIWYLVLLSSPLLFIWVNLDNLFGCSYNLRSISSSATAVIKVNNFFSISAMCYFLGLTTFYTIQLWVSFYLALDHILVMLTGNFAYATNVNHPLVWVDRKYVSHRLSQLNIHTWASHGSYQPKFQFRPL